MKRYTPVKNVNIFLHRELLTMFYWQIFFFNFLVLFLCVLAYECILSFCDAKFRRSDYRNQHIKKFHTDVVFECFACKLTFNTYYELSRHMQRDRHHNLESPDTPKTNENNEKSNVCADCGLIFAKKQQLYDHRRFHKMEEHFCEICSKGFTHPNTYREHMLIHEGKVEHFCHCGKGFVLRRRLRAHEGLL